MLLGKAVQAGSPARAKAKRLSLVEKQARMWVPGKESASSPPGWQHLWVPLCTSAPEGGSGLWTWEEPGKGIVI